MWARTSGTSGARKLFGKIDKAIKGGTDNEITIMNSKDILKRHQIIQTRLQLIVIRWTKIFNLHDH